MSGKCDFCSEANPAWIEEARDISVGLEGLTHGRRVDTGQDGRSVGDWASCETCHQLIAEAHRSSLAQRAARSLARREPHTRGALAHGTITQADLIAMVSRMHSAFWKARTGASHHV